VPLVKEPTTLPATKSATMPAIRLLAAMPVTGALLFATACSETAKTSGDTVAIKATDTTCELATAELPAGAHTFAISNKGSKVTEVYVYAPGDSIVAEKENIGPGTSYRLTVDLKAGSYEIACKPGMKGAGIRTQLTVTPNGDRALDPRLDEAAEAYRAWVQEQADALVPLVEEFAEAIKAGDVERAKALYAPSRQPWERIEPVAESFGDLDPRLDLREADLEEGQEWTGWHRIEKALWVDGSVDGLGPVADQLVADVKELAARVSEADITAASIGNGAKELLDEVATGKVTGEEEAFSHTDLWDFAANLEGAKKAYQLLRAVAADADSTLVTTLDSAFASVSSELASYRVGDGFVSYETVSESQRKALAAHVDALSEPLSKLTATVLGKR
jgi:iron uptake system component EfeO